MKDSWEKKNYFVNLLFEKGYLTDDEHRCLLTGTYCISTRYINVYPDRAWFKDNKMGSPFLTIFYDNDNHKLSISLENGNVVDSSVVKL